MHRFSAFFDQGIVRLVCRPRIALWLGGMAILLMAADTDRSTLPPDADVAPPPAKKSSEAYLVRVPLPLTGMEDTQVMVSIDRLLESLPAGTDRPLLILEFSPTDRSAAGGTRFERALALARYLASDRFSRVRTIAYLPDDVQGHAVLPVLACEEIIVDPDVQVGAAGQDEQTIDNTMREAYREIAMRRRTVPVAIVMGMLDPRQSVVEVQLVDGGVRYVLGSELESVREESEVWQERIIVGQGELGLFTGRQLRLEFRCASQLAKSRRELEEVLNLAAGSLDDQLVATKAWRVLQIDVAGRIATRTADQLVQALQNRPTDEPINLVCVPVNSPGGSPTAALRMVSAISELGPEIRSIAFVDGEARSVAALVALVCDDVYATEDAQIGGPGSRVINQEDLADIQQVLQGLTASQGRDWSPLQAMIDPGLSLFRYRQEGTGQVRYLCEAERQALPDAQQWTREAQLDTQAGISGARAKQIGLVRENAASLQAVFDQLNVGDDISIARPNRTVTAIERLASQPWFGRTLLFVAFFALITEASAPGVGVAGFLSGLCFLLFFWTQFLNGTADWLEVMLFLGGLFFVAVEIAVIPGFGVFGIGGGLMVLSSLVLASQTFVIPRNSYQLDQLPQSLLSMVFASGGMLTALWIMRRFISDSPLFRYLALTPPDEESLDELEAIVDWAYLEGKRGITVTQLTPSGKAKFGDNVIDVISDGTVVSLGLPVCVVEVRGNHVLVEPVDEA